MPRRAGPRCRSLGADRDHATNPTTGELYVSACSGNPKITAFEAPDSGNTGNQIRRFGFTNDGSVDTLFRFFTAVVFHPRQSIGFPLSNPDQTRRDVEQYMLALASTAGQEVTFTCVPPGSGSRLAATL